MAVHQLALSPLLAHAGGPAVRLLVGLAPTLGHPSAHTPEAAGCQLRRTGIEITRPSAPDSVRCLASVVRGAGESLRAVLGLGAAPILNYLGFGATECAQQHEQQKHRLHGEFLHLYYARKRWRIDRSTRPSGAS